MEILQAELHSSETCTRELPREHLPQATVQHPVGPTAPRTRLQREAAEVSPGGLPGMDQWLLFLSDYTPCRRPEGPATPTPARRCVCVQACGCIYTHTCSHATVLSHTEPRANEHPHTYCLNRRHHFSASLPRPVPD